MKTDQHITRGCFNISNGSTEEKRHQCSGCNKLDVFDWLGDLPDTTITPKLIEVRFKNTRKAYYVNNTDEALVKGDIVAVESSPGHDIGVVSLIGELVKCQMKRYGVNVEPRKIYRKAKPNDIEKWFQSIELETDVMRRARQIASDLKLGMKISDVEFQGDKTKATFYYISDERVDFRELIKRFADSFKVRIEMKQIGARQEAGKVGGIGTCGRELCCATWMSSFASVSTNAARYQEVSLNPQKLAGQCGKLKCCLNYELKCYLDALNDFPNTSVPLETEQGRAYHRKTDVFRRLIWYSFEKEDSENSVFIPLDVDTVREIISLNQQGIKIKELNASLEGQPVQPAIGYQNAVGEDSISRFEEKRRKKKKGPRGQGGRNNVDNKAPVGSKPPVGNNPPRNKGQSENKGRENQGQRENREPRENRDNRENRDSRRNRDRQPKRTDTPLDNKPKKQTDS